MHGETVKFSNSYYFSVLFQVSVWTSPIILSINECVTTKHVSYVNYITSRISLGLMHVQFIYGKETDDSNGGRAWYELMFVSPGTIKVWQGRVVPWKCEDAFNPLKPSMYHQV